MTDMREQLRQSPRETLREAFISGLAVVVPVLITLLVLTIAINSVYQYLDLFANSLAQIGVTTLVPGLVVDSETVIELLSPLVLFVLILLVGLLVNSSQYGERAVDYFDEFITDIPGIGSVYESFREMSDVMLESDTQNFREVKLVEFPHEGAYTLGFVTTETPEPLREPTGHGEMLTLFLPLAPNPVMGGHLVHMPADRVMDVDMTVEEGLRTVVTSGVAVAAEGGTERGLPPERLQELGAVEYADQQLTPEQASPAVRRTTAVRPDRPDRYDDQVSPAVASTPQDIVRRERESAAPSDERRTPSDLERSRDRHEPGGDGVRSAHSDEDAETSAASSAGDDADASTETASDDERGEGGTDT